VPGALAAEQWVQLTKFRHYTFCKSHAVSYGLLAWLGSYFKTHHPLCFWTAVLNNNQGSYPRRVYVEAIKRAGIELRLPCVNCSAGPFSIEDGAIRVGLDAIANLPQELKSAILAERRHGLYRDLGDFRRRVTPGAEALAILIRCGALDFTGRTRPALFLEADLQDRSQESGVRSQGSGCLFSDSWLLTPDSCNWSPPDYSPEQRLRDEWALLGFVLGPPLMALFRPQLPSGLITSPAIPAHLGRTVSLAGMTATARQARTSDGRDMQFLTLEDEWGLVEVTLFAGTCPQLIALGLGPYLATGRVEDHLGVLALNARNVVRWKGSM
jgi:DNA polymerase-3 subunit alpha